MFPQSDPNIEAADRKYMTTELGPHKRDTFMNANLLVCISTRQPASDHLLFPLFAAE
jgi:hypothetical protein